MSLPNLIGITGYARHGKGTIAKTLAKRHGYEIISFAAPVRDFLLQTNPLIEVYRPTVAAIQGHHDTPLASGIRLKVIIAQYGWDHAKKRFPDIRQLLQRLGTEAAKPLFGDDCWARIAMQRAYEITKFEGGRVCFDDLRFPREEGEAILNKGYGYIGPHSAEIWRVTRYNKDGSIYNNGIGTDHPSERQVKNFEPDEEISNFSVKLLEATINEMVRNKRDSPSTGVLEREEIGIYKPSRDSH